MYLPYTFLWVVYPRAHAQSRTVRRMCIATLTWIVIRFVIGASMLVALARRHDAGWIVSARIDGASENALELPEQPRPAAGECEPGAIKLFDLCYSSFVVYASGTVQPGTNTRTGQRMYGITREAHEAAPPCDIGWLAHFGDCRKFFKQERGLCICAKPPASG